MINLVWFTPDKTGYRSLNVLLEIDTDNHKYRLTNTQYQPQIVRNAKYGYGSTRTDFIEAVRKSDLTDYATILDKEGYQRVE